MSCRFSHLQEGQIVEADFIDTICGACGNMYNVSATVVYMGHSIYDGIVADSFQYKSDVYCSECLNKKDTHILPCGDGYGMEIAKQEETVYK